MDQHSRVDWPARFFFFGFSVTVVVRLGGVLAGIIHGIKYPSPIDRSDMHPIVSVSPNVVYISNMAFKGPFGRGVGVIFTSIIILHMFIVLLICLLYYGLPSFAMRHRLLCLKSELETLGERRSITDSTISFYTDFKALMDNVVHVNHHVQVPLR